MVGMVAPPLLRRLSGLWVSYPGQPYVPELPRLGTTNFTPYFVEGASREALDLELLRSEVHTPKYLKMMCSRTAKASVKGSLVELETSAGYTAVTEQAARIASAALIDATLAVWAGRFRTAFVMCRPPTHHAVGNASCCRNQSKYSVKEKKGGRRERERGKGWGRVGYLPIVHPIFMAPFYMRGFGVFPSPQL